MMLPSITNQTFSVNENVASNSIVSTIQATDDIGITGFAITNGNDGNVFAVNNVGLLTSIGNIDYETTSNYRLDIQVSDKGGNTSNATITIKVTNIEDENPIISNKTFMVSESVSNHATIGTVPATDDVGIAFYAIIGGNIGGVFDISSSGELTTTARLNYDDIANYNLLVLVADMVGNNAIAIITVSVTDVDADPAVTTGGTSALQNNSLTLSGEITDLGTNSDGSNQVNEYGFVYSHTASQKDELQIGKIGVEGVGGARLTNTGVYSFAIANLSPCTDYYYRAFAVNDSGASYGEVSNLSTANQAFTLSGVGDGEQTSLVCAGGTHTYNVTLSHELVYSLSVDASSNVMDSVTIYEGNNTEPLYIQAGYFSVNAPSTAINFPGASNGRRYMVLPLSNNSHRILLSNNSSQNESYSLNLEEYQGTSPATRRLLLAPQKMGYYDSTNDPRYFWVHMPANKRLRVEFDEYRGISNSSDVFDRATLLINFPAGSSTFPAAGFTPSFNAPTTLNNSSNGSYYTVVTMRNTTSIITGAGQQTNFRLILRFVD